MQSGNYGSFSVFGRRGMLRPCCRVQIMRITVPASDSLKLPLQPNPRPRAGTASPPSPDLLELASLEERIDTSSAAGELVFHVFGALAAPCGM